MDKPFLYPFAKDGDRNTELPNANATDNSVSFQSGFTLPYELNPANGGKNLERKDMNEIFFRICDAINNISQEVDKWVKLTTENLNDIKQPGRYNQMVSRNAIPENNYPINQAGFLIVVLTGQYALTQIYKGWQDDKIYTRRNKSISQDSNAWTEWDSFVLTSEFNNKITSLQNTDTNLNNNKEDKTKFTNRIINATTNSNLDNLTQNGFYWRKSNQGSPLPTNNGGAVIVNTNGSQVIQCFYTDVWNSSTGGAWFRTRDAGGTWTDWHHLENSEHAEATYRKIADSYTKTETDNILNQKENKTKISAQSLDDENLNDINISGFYRQETNAKATAANNYPKTEAGTLIVLIPSGSGSGSTYLTQIYIVKDGNGIFTRARKNNLSWTDWEKLALKSEVDLKRNISDSYSKTEVDTKLNLKRNISDSYSKSEANSTFRKIADSYTKTETNTQINNAVNSTTHRYKALRCNPSANTIQWQTGGMSISKVNNSTFRITHNLGMTNYCVTCTSNQFGSLGAAASNVINIQPNYCDIASYWGGDNTNGSGLPTMMNIAIFY